MARPNKKKEIMEQSYKLFEEWQPLNERLFKLVDENKITSGCLLVYTSSENFGMKQLLEIGNYLSSKAYNTTIWHFNYYLNDARKGYEKSLKFAEEQEAATMEDCQKAQVLKEWREQVGTER